MTENKLHERAISVYQDLFGGTRKEEVHSRGETLTRGVDKRNRESLLVFAMDSKGFRQEGHEKGEGTKFYLSSHSFKMIIISIRR